MPTVYLKETEGIYYSEFVIVKVKKEDHSNSNLFKKYTHEPMSNFKSGNIWIYNESFPDENNFVEILDFFGFLRFLAFFLSKNYLIITPETFSGDLKLQKVEVYYNKYDTKQTPLVFVLHFDGLKNKYYKRSQFDKDISGNKSKSINNLSNYNNERELLNELIKENDSIVDVLTYDIGRKKGDANEDNGGESNEYNRKKIKIEEDPDSDPKFTSPGFKLFKHTPKDGNGSDGNSNKPACVIFNNEVLLDKGKTELSGVQNIKYEYISVYFSDIVREPLLIELNQGVFSKNTNNKYYYHTRDDDGSLYWVEITKRSDVLGVKFDSQNSVHSQLTSSENNKLLKVLKAIEPHLLKTSIIMINKQGQYGLTNIKSSFEKWKTYRIINNEITPSDKTWTKGKCLQNTGFRVYEHDFTDTVKDIVEFEEVQLKFIIPKSKDNKYNEITFEGKNDLDHEYECDCSVHKSSEKTLYVYFYGSDPRPLLLCYNGEAYRPTDLDTYNEKWCYVSGIESCECSDPGFESNIEKLLKTLYQVSMFLNPVKLNETIKAYEKVKPVIDKRKQDKEKGGKIGKLPDHVYTVQTFGDTEIRVRVKAKDLLCYRVYTHTPAMAEGSSSIKREYRLGDIYYGPDRKADQTCLSYPQELPLQSVSLYYYMYDEQHRYPLLIQLDYGFGGPLDDYYRVCKTDSGNGAQSSIPGPNGGAELPKNISPFSPRKP